MNRRKKCPVLTQKKKCPVQTQKKKKKQKTTTNFLIKNVNQMQLEMTDN